MIDAREFNPICERAFLIGIKNIKESAEEATYHLEELKGLVHTMGIEIVGSDLVSLKSIKPQYLIGSGKAEEIKGFAMALKADIIVFDEELSPSQQRNWEALCKNIAVIDRQEVILDIFADRAQTRGARLQVALARMEYSLPRLTRAWTHLSRQRGGAKGTRGEGETQLEVDRRITLSKIAKLKKDIAQVAIQRDTQRKKRQERPVPLVSIVGYTNAGKSSLLNTLTNANTFVEDKLFATLDTNTKRIKVKDNLEILMSDTVGFIRKLPHGLIDSFKSTLEETMYADFLIHLVDINSFELDSHIKTTLEVLKELDIQEKDMLLVFNKVDVLDHTSFENKKSELRMQYGNNIFFISTLTAYGLENLRQAIVEKISLNFRETYFLIPHGRGDIISILKKESKIIEERYEDVVFIRALVPEALLGRLKDFIVGNL